MNRERVNGADILYPERCQEYVADYRAYVLSLLRQVVVPSSIVLLDCMIDVPQKTIRIAINYEHTLVKRGGRDSENSTTGIIRVLNDSSNRYLVRIVNEPYLSTCDVVIDYSIPNIMNVQSSRRFPNLTDAHVYIAPCIYDISWNLQGRTIDLLTTFLNPGLPRRIRFSEVCKNVSDCFDSAKICALYQTTKVLINIHQTDDHHTAEELRILPALQNGVIVVCEDSPLRDVIPYHAMIIWASYETILETAKGVLETYEDTWNRTFTESNMRLLRSLHTQNLVRLGEKLTRI